MFSLNRPYYYDYFPVAKRSKVISFCAWVVPEVEYHYNSRRKASVSTSIFREFYYDYESDRYNGMPAKKPKSDKSVDSKQWIKPSWANVPLSPDDEPIIVERANNQEDCIGGLLELFDGGFSVSIKRRDDNKTVQVTITGMSLLDHSKSIGLSAYAPDVWIAISALLYKYHDVAGGELESFCGNQGGSIG